MNMTNNNQFNNFIIKVFTNTESNRIKENEYDKKDLCDLHFCRRVFENINLINVNKSEQYISMNDLQKLVFNLNHIYINNNNAYLEFKFRKMDFFKEALKEKIKNYNHSKNSDMYASIIKRSISSHKKITIQDTLNIINFHDFLDINDFLYICERHNIEYLPSVNGIGNDNFEGYYNILNLDHKKLQNLLYLKTSKNNLSHYIIDIYDKMSAIKVIIDGITDHELNNLLLKTNINWSEVRKNKDLIRDSEKKKYRLECEYNNYNDFINYINSIFGTNIQIDNKKLFEY